MIRKILTTIIGYWIIYIYYVVNSMQGHSYNQCVILLLIVFFFYASYYHPFIILLHQYFPLSSLRLFSSIWVLGLSMPIWCHQSSNLDLLHPGIQDQRLGRDCEISLLSNSRRSSEQKKETKRATITITERPNFVYMQTVLTEIKNMMIFRWNTVYICFLSSLFKSKCRQPKVVYQM